MDENIELWVFLKLKGLAKSGGEAKLLIRSSQVKVNDIIVHEKKKKLKIGDIVEFSNIKYTVSHIE